MSHMGGRRTHAKAVAAVAVFIALGGTTTGAVLITGKNVRNGSLASAEIKRRSIGSVDIREAVNYPTGDGPYSIAIADLTGDGHADLAVAADSFSVLPGRGDGTFANRIEYPVRPAPVTVAVGDLNGDGRSDVAVASMGVIDGASGGVSVLLARGDGTLAPAGTYPPARAWSAVIGDLDGDGRPDLAGTEGDGRFAWGRFGVGDGGFGPLVKYRVGPSPGDVVGADLNSDGRSDLVFSHDFADYVSVLLGQGNRSIGPLIKTRAPFNFGMAVGNLDGDQSPDLVTVSDRVEVRLGTGRGSFGRAVRYRAGQAPQAVAIGDLNGDPYPDLAVANSHSRNVSVFLGKGRGRFRRAANYRAHLAPWSVAIGDLNGDQHSDIAVANKNSADASVFLNAAP